MSQPLEIGCRRELFVDDWLLDRCVGGAQRRLHHPTPRQIVIEHDQPWEGNVSGYHTIFHDGDVYRMYYRGAHADPVTQKSTHPHVVCYAQSDDGIHWTKPNLNLCEFNGSTQNNIIWAGRGPGDSVGTHNFSPFKDTNPACDPAARYKALSNGSAIIEGEKYSGLLPFQSPDGLHWSFMRQQPVIQDGRFDSQNLAFFDIVRGEYRAYWRDLQPGTPLFDPQREKGVRAIKTATSADFLNWTPGVFLDYGDAPPTHLYTNQVMPYPRAPHLLIGFPTRYIACRDSLTEGLLMSSRDGVHFQRWDDALIRPGLNRARWGNRSNYIWHGLPPTASDVAGEPDELSLYTIEGYYDGESNAVRRFTYRQDGFVSLHAGFSGGEAITKPLRFEGQHLELNVSTSAAGSVRVEIQDADGRPLEGFALDDCHVIYGDNLAEPVQWQQPANLGKLAGQAVRLRFELQDADVFSLQFRAEA